MPLGDPTEQDAIFTAYGMGLKDGRALEREHILDAIEDEMRFQNECAELGEKSGAEMSAVRGAVSILSILKRRLTKEKANA